MNMKQPSRMTYSIKYRHINAIKYPKGKYSMDPFTKVCKVCLVEKKHIDFVWWSHTKKALSDTCLDCYNASQRKRRLKRIVKTYPRIGDDVLVKCTKCAIEKPAIDFYTCRNHRHGIAYNCKECENSRPSKYKRKSSKPKRAPKLRVVKNEKESADVNKRTIKVLNLAIGDEVIFMASGHTGIKAIRRVKEIFKFHRTSRIEFEKHKKFYYWEHLEEVDLVDHSK